MKTEINMNRGKMDLQNIKSNEWEKYWAVNMSGFSCSLFGYLYTKYMPEKYGVGFVSPIVFTSKGYSVCYFQLNDRKRFAEKAIADFAANKQSIRKFCEFLKNKSDRFIDLMDNLEDSGFSRDDFEKYKAAFLDYSVYHIMPRHFTDYLPEKLSLEYLDDLKDLRLYLEKIYAVTENFVEKIAESWAKKSGYTVAELLCCTVEEIESFYSNGKLPSKDELQRRDINMVQVFENGKSNILVGDEVDHIEKKLTEAPEVSEIKGMTAYKGIAKGVVRIVFDPRKVDIFNEGDILVTGMTRPDYLLLMKKASAIVTDAGGLLCHAAITAREIGKPCIIGTKNATKILKDGDMVEVDADNGIVKIMEIK